MVAVVGQLIASRYVALVATACGICIQRAAEHLCRVFDICSTCLPAAATACLLCWPWQQTIWARRPLNVVLFYALSILDTEVSADRPFLMGFVRNGAMLFPDVGLLAPLRFEQLYGYIYASALAESPTISAMLADEVAQGWTAPVSSPPAYFYPLGAVLNWAHVCWVHVVCSVMCKLCLALVVSVSFARMWKLNDLLFNHVDTFLSWASFSEEDI